MITKEMIRAGMDAGIVQLINSPNDAEPACQIGEHWFYYAGAEGSGLTSAQYVANIPMEEIVREIVDALNGIRDDLNGDEYRYYEAVLQEAGITGEQGETYKAELHYAWQRSHETYDIYHAFELADPKEQVSEEDMDKMLADRLNTTPEDDHYRYNSMDVKIPDSIVRRIQNDYDAKHKAGLLNKMMDVLGEDQRGAYEYYRLHWLSEHGYSLADLVRNLYEYQYRDPEDSDRISMPITELMEAWEAEGGFNGDIWTSFKEFVQLGRSEVAK